MTIKRLEELMNQFSKIKIAVIGDLFLDKWIHIDREKDELSVETGLVAYQVVSKRPEAGAAGTVLNNLSVLGVGTLYAVSLVGDDGEGYEVLQALEKRGIDIGYVIKSGQVITPTYEKPLFFGKGQQGEEGNRIDYKNTKTTPRLLVERIINNLREVAGKVDAVMVLDQLAEENTGVVTKEVRDALSRLGSEFPELLIFADSRSFIQDFRNVILKCNDKEATTVVTGKRIEAFDMTLLCNCMDTFSKQTNSKVFITCGEHGILVKDDDGYSLIPPVNQSGKINVCGAGDACSSGIVTALCANASDVEAAALGNLTAGVTVRKIGTTGTVNQKEVLAIFNETNPERES